MPLNEPGIYPLKPPLFVPLKSEYYAAFVAGIKNEELRLYGPRWNEKTCSIGRAVTLSNGYGKQNRTAGKVFAFRRINACLLPKSQQAAVLACYGQLDIEIAVITIDINRRLYQKTYHEKNRSRATQRKQNEDYDRSRARAYWRFRLYIGVEKPDLLNGISQNIIDQEERRYRRELDEPAEVVKNRKLTTKPER